MYSPKIAERLIPPLYRLARVRGQHMTTIVNEVLAAYLAGNAVEAPGREISPARSTALASTRARSRGLPARRAA